MNFIFISINSVQPVKKGRGEKMSVVDLNFHTL